MSEAPTTSVAAQRDLAWAERNELAQRVSELELLLRVVHALYGDLFAADVSKDVKAALAKVRK